MPKMHKVDRSASHFLLALALVLVLFPLALGKPGLPLTLKADEPAYYLMALSLADDGDLLCTTEDLDRLDREFPNFSTHNLILMTDNGWNTVYFGKPYIYSLFAAPLARLFGANGIVAFNMLLLFSMIGMGASYLRRFNPEPTATLFSVGFFLLSSAATYTFWLQPEIFNMAAVMACLYVALHEFQPAIRGGKLRDWWAKVWNEATRPLWSGAALSLAVYNKPMLGALALPALYVFWRRQGLRSALRWVTGAVACMALVAGLAYGLTGHPSAYLGVERGGISILEPGVLPITPRPPSEKPTVENANSWHWMFRIPEIEPGRLFEDLGYFLWGRHTGLLPYMPFAFAAFLLFLINGRRSPRRWILLASLGIVALTFLLWIPFNWHGGGGFIGNRYFVNTYPAFLFLVTAIRPAGAIFLSYAAGALLMGPILFTVLGVAVVHPTLQAHVRNKPFRYFPYELSLRSLVPGYHGVAQMDVWLWGRKDVFGIHGDTLWIQGVGGSEVWVMAPEPIQATTFLVRNFAARNPVRISMGGDHHTLQFSPQPGPEGETQRVLLRPRKSFKVRMEKGRPNYIYRMIVKTRTGKPLRILPEEPERVLVGAMVVHLGAAEILDRDIYDVQWGTIEAPDEVLAEDIFTLLTSVRNLSAYPWPAKDVVRVKLSYRWRSPSGETISGAQLRTELSGEVAAGDWLEVEQFIQAPDDPGDYLLELDLVREHAAWFSDENGGNTLRLPLKVLPAVKTAAERFGE